MTDQGTYDTPAHDAQGWLAVDPAYEALASEEERLAHLVEDLRRREHDALMCEMSPEDLRALASERDRIAAARDRVAEAYDEAAAARDRSGLHRDVSGSARDRNARAIADDLDPGFPDRSLSGSDRDLAAGDRGDSHDDRARNAQGRQQAAADRAAAAADRDRADGNRTDVTKHATADVRELEGLRAALESRTLIGQAQGLLMSRYEVTADAAFAILTRISQHENIKLREIAAKLVAETEQPTDH